MDERAVTHRTLDAEFADLVYADDDLVRREFEALIAHGWGPERPPGPVCGAGGRRRGVARAPSTLPGPACCPAVAGTPWQRQRGPPG